MPTQVQFRRGNEGQNNNFKGAAGEISINTDTNSIRVHNGITTGGFELARDDLSNVGNASISGILTAAQFVGDGSGLTNLVATGVGVEIRDNISVVGTAATIDFGDNLVVSLAAGVATVTALNTSKWGASPSGIVTTSNVGIGTTDPQYALHVIGDVRIVGVLTVGNSSVTIDGNTNTINIGTGVTVYGNTGIVSAAALYVNGANISNVSGYASTAGIATVASGLTPTASVNTTGIITASKFVGDGSGLTNLPVSSDFVRTSAGIHTLGNVGVGTTNPITKLQVGSVFNPQVIGFGTVLGYVHAGTNILLGDKKTGSSLTPQVGGLWKGLDNIFMGAGAGASNTTGNANNFFGLNAGCSNSTGYYNNFFGLYSGCSNTTGNGNNFLGSYETGIKNTTGSDNNFIGYGAGRENTVGSYNNFFGSFAGYCNTTGSYNNFFGFSAGCGNTTGCYNNFFGMNAGRCNTSGYNNNFFGDDVGYNNTIGFDNNFLGNAAGYCNTTGNNNNFFGFNSGYNNTTGFYNNFFGYRAGYANTTGDNNNFFGPFAGYYNTTGNNNNFLGNAAGYCNITGTHNNFSGYRAGYYNTTGSSNNFLGGRAGLFNSTGSWNNFLGSYSGIHTDKSFRVVLGSGFYDGGYNSYFIDTPKDADKQFAVGLNTTGTAEYWLVGDENFNIGIGTTQPIAKLHVNGPIAISASPIFMAKNTVDESVVIPSGYNAMSIGPILTVGTGVTVTVESGANWFVLGQ